ncbi:MAG: afr 2 [Verrucomicrobiaceae bacterium]|nr:afr 2 [Verrucomicrobiaceae bacterium]
MSFIVMNEALSSPSAGLTPFMDRRNFLRTSVLTGTGVYLATSKGAVAQQTSPDRKLKVALVGAGAQGKRLLESCSDIEGIQFVAVCDVWAYNRNQTAARIKHSYGDCNAYVDIDEMLAKEKDVDCVLIAVPDFLHAPFTRMALQAGKSVYCEKLMANTIDAAKDMVKSQRETGGILQIGHQRHSNPRYINVRDNILYGNNMLGRVTHCYGQWNRGVSASVPLTTSKSTEIDAATLTKYGFGSMEEFLNWRFFSKYGGGPIADLGAHQIDMFNWFLKSTPTSVIATGGVDYYDGKDGRAKFELPDNVMAIYEYKLPAGTTRAYYQVLTTTGSQAYYEKLMGIDGSCVISESPTTNQIYREPNAPSWIKYSEGDNPILARSAASVHNKWWEKPKPWFRAPSWMDVKADSRESKALEAYELGVTLARKPHSPHLENFFNCARKKDPKGLNCPVEEAFKSCVTVLKVYESIKTGAKYEFKPEDFTV